MTGFFGQNFGWLVDHIGGPWQFLVFGVCGLFVPLIALRLWLRSKKSMPENPLGAAD